MPQDTSCRGVPAHLRHMADASSRQTSAAPASSPKRMISASGGRAATAERVALDRVNMPGEGLRCRKEVITAHAPQNPISLIAHGVSALH